MYTHERGFSNYDLGCYIVIVIKVIHIHCSHYADAICPLLLFPVITVRFRCSLCALFTRVVGNH